MKDEQIISKIVANALAEDIGSGDVTSAYFVPETQKCRSRVVARQAAVIAGIGACREAFRQVDSTLHVVPLVEDGDAVSDGEEVMLINGSTRSILRAERVSLNLLQQLSGVASMTRRFVDEIRGTKAKILDTRKTVPGLRVLQKKAVLAGGGANHRMGLWDRVMIKDNHLLAGSSPKHLQECIDSLKRDRPDILVEFEADTLRQVKMFLDLRGVDIILLDNMAPNDMREAITMGQGRVRFEASGGVNLNTARRVAETGVDFISIGALTHSPPAVDLSLEILQ
jgi:nicotinate-nucleotide pyrophosphorylase (carboxylating)